MKNLKLNGKFSRFMEKKKKKKKKEIGIRCDKLSNTKAIEALK